MPTRRTLLASMGTIALLVAAGCSDQSAATPREPGCAVPRNEDALLNDYATDGVLAFEPDGARRTRPVDRQHGCLRLNKEDVSQTSATTNFMLSRDYDQSSLRAAYDPVAASHGWALDTSRQAQLGPDAGGPFIAYCREVRGVTTELSVSASSAQRYDERPSSPARPPSPQWRVEPGVVVLVIAAAPRRSNCDAPA